MPELSDTLLHSYRKALYRVRAPGGHIDLRIGRRSSELAALLRIRGVRSAAFLTACNPRSEIRPPAWNTQATRRLRAELRLLGLRTLTGLGLDERGKWPEEESVLVLGITRDQAASLGRRFGQHAVVWVDADARPRLLTCGENADVR